jgi:hypothetical protein
MANGRWVGVAECSSPRGERLRRRRTARDARFSVYRYSLGRRKGVDAASTRPWFHGRDDNPLVIAETESVNSRRKGLSIAIHAGESHVEMT